MIADPTILVDYCGHVLEEGKTCKGRRASIVTSWGTAGCDIKERREP